MVEQFFCRFIDVAPHLRFVTRTEDLVLGWLNVSCVFARLMRLWTDRIDMTLILTIVRNISTSHCVMGQPMKTMRFCLSRMKTSCTTLQSHCSFTLVLAIDSATLTRSR
jgi:hypothetical protein